MKQIVVKQASLKDTGTLLSIGMQTFFETYAHSNTEEDMKKYLEENFNEERLQKELGSRDSLFYIAWEEENPIGYLKLNSGKAQTELQDEASLEIERIYVKGVHQGKNVGQLLYEKAVEVALLQKKTYIWLGVWEENPRAIRFYEKNGFVPFGRHIFKLGKDEQTDIMMKKQLTPLGKRHNWG